MSVRKNEFSSLAIRVIGTRISEATGKIVQGTEREDDLRTVLETCRTKHVNLMSSLVKLSNSDSQIYEEIGIEQITIKKEKKVEFFHFALAYIKRGKEDIHLKEKDNNYKTKTITIGDKEVQ